MLFRRIILSALAVGAVTGALLGLGQHFGASQLIFAAEAYEGGAVPGQAAQEATAAASESTGHSHADEDGHGHGGAEAWAPADGSERFTWSVLSAMFVATGFGTMLLIGMYMARRGRGASLGLGQGALWGLGGFLALFGAPALGLPPEVPGAAAASLEARQVWWAATVLVTAAGLGLLAFAPGWKKAIGVSLLPIPHIFGAPHPDGPLFSHPDPSAVEALQTLHADFIVSTVVTNAVFWVVLGMACAWATKRWVLREETAGGTAPVHA